MTQRKDLRFQVIPSSGTPVFRQVHEQVIRLIASGELQSGDILPSIREVGKQLAINPMTISKAYSLLEEHGVLIRRKGIGMEVRAPKTPRDEFDRLRLLDEPLHELVIKTKQLNLDPGIVIHRFRDLMADDHDDS